MISFPMILVNAASVILIAAVIIYAWKKRRNTAVKEFIVAAVFMIIWAVSSFIEIAAVDLDQKILWRNITQIGVFYVPPASLIFSIAYSGILKNRKKIISYIIYSMQTISILLIFTDEWHHLMRKSIQLVQTGVDPVITVETTLLSNLLISFNFIYMSAAVILLIIYAVKTTNNMRKQVLFTLGGMGIAVVYALVKVASSEQVGKFLPISGIFALVSLMLLLGMFRYDFLAVLPVARNEVFNIIHEGIIVCAVNGEVLDANDAAIHIFSKNASIKIERNTNGFKEIDTLLHKQYPRWYDAIVSCRFDQFDISQYIDGETCFYQCKTYVLDINKKHAGTISVIRDITEQKLRNDLLKHKAEHDSLIDIYNRHTFIEHIDNELCRYKKEASLIFFDLDDFKGINDRYGHLAGDYVLKEVCSCIKNTIGIDSVIGRMGGEEFAVFFKGKDLKSSLDIAESLRKNIEGKQFEFNGSDIDVTISVGIATGCGTSFVELYQTADKMLYQAKDAGKNCVRA